VPAGAERADRDQLFVRFLFATEANAERFKREGGAPRFAPRYGGYCAVRHSVVVRCFVMIVPRLETHPRINPATESHEIHQIEPYSYLSTRDCHPFQP